MTRTQVDVDRIARGLLATGTFATDVEAKRCAKQIMRVLATAGDRSEPGDLATEAKRFARAHGVPLDVAQRHFVRAAYAAAPVPIEPRRADESAEDAEERIEATLRSNAKKAMKHADLIVARMLRDDANGWNPVKVQKEITSVLIAHDIPSDLSAGIAVEAMRKAGRAFSTVTEADDLPPQIEASIRYRRRIKK